MVTRRRALLAIVASGLLAATGATAQAPGDFGHSGTGGAHGAQYARYAAATDHAQASLAAAEILEAGGTAADAAAAAMLALGVVSPASSGLGGGGFALYYRADDRSLTFLDFREAAPAASTADMFAGAEARADDGPLSQPSQLGGLASGVPGEGAGIDELLRRFGVLDRARVVAPAIRFAADGFEADAGLAGLSEFFGAQMRADPTMAAWFEPGQETLRAGQVIRRPRLAQTLRAFARAGAAALYRGRTAREIAAASRRAGGIMTAEDLAAYRVTEREPLSAVRFGLRWVTAPPPSAGGFTMLQSLALLERWVPAERRRMDADFLHALAESWKGPFVDRQFYFGDPSHVALPLEALGAPERIAARARAFHPTLAIAASEYALPLTDTDGIAQRDNAGTSHLCVVDAAGNVAAVTTTVNLPFGARYSAAGIVMNDEMDDFAREIGRDNAFGLPGGAPNLPGPGRRPVSTMSPTIVLDDEGPVLCVGASGGSRIVTAVQQVALRTLLFGEPLPAAVAAPRIHHQGMPNQLRTEEFAPLEPALLAALVARGHVHEPIRNVATVQAIHIRRGGGPRLVAASDPRKGGRPAGD